MSKKEKSEEKEEESAAEKASKDAWQHIHSFLSPEDSASLSKARKKTYKAGKAQELWKERFKRDFPHYYIAFKDEIKSASKLSFEEFYKWCYKKDYKGLTDAERKLFSWVKLGDLESIRKYKPQPAELIIRDKQFRSVIHWAVKHDRQDMLDYFFGILNRSNPKQRKQSLRRCVIMCRQDVDEFDGIVLDGKAARLAAAYGNLDLLKKIFQASLEDISEQDRYACLDLASLNGQADVVSYLLSQGIEDRDNTALLKANNPEVIKAFMENPMKKFDPKILNSVLVKAADLGAIPMLRYLLQQDVDINAKAEFGDTKGLRAVNVAIKRKDYDLAKFLIERGANCRDLHVNVAAHYNFELLTHMIKYDPDIINIEYNGYTPLTLMRFDYNSYTVKAQKFSGDLICYIYENKIPLSEKNIGIAIKVSAHEVKLDQIEYFMAQKNADYKAWRKLKRYMRNYVSYPQSEKVLQFIKLHDLKHRYENQHYRHLSFFGKTVRYSSEEKLTAVNHVIDYEGSGHKTNPFNEHDKVVLKKAIKLHKIYKRVKDELEAPEEADQSAESKQLK